MNMVMILALLLGCLVGLAMGGGGYDGDTKGLYLYYEGNGEPNMRPVPVKEYTETGGKFQTSTAPKIVEFYSPHCFACQQFSSQYVQLAKEVRKEYPGVEFYAVSCSPHGDICREHKVNAYPTLLAFPENTPEEEGGKIVKRNSFGKYGPKVIANALGLAKSDNRIVRTETESSAELNSGTVVERRIAQADDDSAKTGSSSAVGKEGKEKREGAGGKEEVAGEKRKIKLNRRPVNMATATDLSSWTASEGTGAQKVRTKEEIEKWKDEVRKKREDLLKKKKGKLLKEAAAIVQRGATKEMAQNTPGTNEYKGKNTFRQQLRERRESLAKAGDTPQATKRLSTSRYQQLKERHNARMVAKKVPVIKRMVKRTSEEDLHHDAVLSLVSTLSSQVFNSEDPLDAKRKEALRDWIELLSISLPPEWGVHALLDTLSTNIDYISQKHENLMKMMSRFTLSDRNWSKDCSNGIRNRGEACGFWKLLHVMSVGVAEHKGGSNLVYGDIVDSDTRVFSPAEAAAVLREYMANFFGCTKCRDHFVAEYDQCAFDRCTRLSADVDELDEIDDDEWKQFALWLWKLHNSVSVRISNEKFNRRTALKKGKAKVEISAEEEVKSITPNLEQCFSCYRDDGSFDEDAVFRFLEKTYWGGAEEDDLPLSGRNKGPSHISYAGIFALMLAAFTLLSSKKVPVVTSTIVGREKKHGKHGE